jgi:hypothetical protein
MAGAIVAITKFNMDLLTDAGLSDEHDSSRRDGVRELRRLHGMIADEPAIALPPCPLERLAFARHPSPPTVRWVPPDPAAHTANAVRELIREMIDELKLHGIAPYKGQGFRQKPR